MALIKGIIWFVVSTVVELFCSFVIAAILVLVFNLAAVPFLAGLGYWQLYWLQMAVYESISSAVVMGIMAYEFMQD